MADDTLAAELTPRVAHVSHALMEAWTWMAGEAPVTAAEVAQFDGEALTVRHTAAALAEARKKGLAAGRRGYWYATDLAWSMRRSLEDRYMAEVFDA